MHGKTGRKDKIESLFADATLDRQVSHKSKTISGHKNSFGTGNIVIHGNVTLQNDTTHEPEYITQDQGYEIQQLIYKIADLDTTCGYSFGNTGSARKKWWYVLRKRFKTGSYKNIRYDRYKDVLGFLNYHREKLKAEAAKTSNSGWRNKQYSAIYAKCKERNVTKTMLYQMTGHYLDIEIDSLTQLADADLKHLYNIVMVP